MQERVSSERAWQFIRGQANYGDIAIVGEVVSMARDLLDARQRIAELEEVGLALYYAGFWSCDREVDEAALWEHLRNALDLPMGTSPKRILRGEALDVPASSGGESSPLERGEEPCKSE